MDGAIEIPKLPDSPLIPAEAHEIRDTFAALANAKGRIVRADKVGSIGAYAFTIEGGAAFLILPLKSATVLPGMTGNIAPSAMDVEQTLGVSSPPTQAEVTAIRDYARAGFRILDALLDVLKANNFPS